jgi:hypothetical protein
MFGLTWPIHQGGVLGRGESLKQEKNSQLNFPNTYKTQALEFNNKKNFKEIHGVCKEPTKIY